MGLHTGRAQLADGSAGTQAAGNTPGACSRSCRRNFLLIGRDEPRAPEGDGKGQGGEYSPPHAPMEVSWTSPDHIKGHSLSGALREELDVLCDALAVRRTCPADSAAIFACSLVVLAAIPVVRSSVLRR